jgi:hypothetical protein
VTRLPRRRSARRRSIAAPEISPDMSGAPIS